MNEFTRRLIIEAYRDCRGHEAGLATIWKMLVRKYQTYIARMVISGKIPLPKELQCPVNQGTASSCEGCTTSACTRFAEFERFLKQWTEENGYSLTVRLQTLNEALHRLGLRTDVIDYGTFLYNPKTGEAIMKEVCDAGM